MRIVILILVVCCLGQAIPAKVAAEANSTPLLLVAVLPNPSQNDLQAEWLQLYNTSSQALELTDLQLKLTGKLTALNLLDTTLAAKEHLILARQPESVMSIFPNAALKQANFSLPNRLTELELWYRGVKMNGWEYQNSTTDIVSYYSFNCQKVLTEPLAEYDILLPVVHNCSTNEQVLSASATSAKTDTMASKHQQDKLYQQLVALNQIEIKPVHRYDKDLPKQAAKMRYKSYNSILVKRQSLGRMMRLLAISVTVGLLAIEIYYWLLKLADLPVLGRLRGRIRPP